MKSQEISQIIQWCSLQLDSSPTDLSSHETVHQLRIGVRIQYLFQAIFNSNLKCSGIFQNFRGQFHGPWFGVLRHISKPKGSISQNLVWSPLEYF